MPRPRLKRLSPWILVALAFLLALSLSIDAVRRDSSVAVAPPPAPEPSKAPATSLKTIAEPLTAAEQPAAGLKKIRSSGGRSAGLKEIPPAEGRLQRTRFGQDGALVKMVPQEKIVEEPLAALGPELRPARANPDPNSVFSWGPWSQTTSLARVDNGLVENDAGSQGYVRTAIVTQARQDTAGGRSPSEGLSPPVGNPPTAFTPPVVVTPPLAGGTKPGHGFGDRNHTHQHRRGSGR